jgi:hypothetical protein
MEFVQRYFQSRRTDLANLPSDIDDPWSFINKTVIGNLTARYVFEIVSYYYFFCLLYLRRLCFYLLGVKFPLYLFCG